MGNKGLQKKLEKVENELDEIENELSLEKGKKK